MFHYEVRNVYEFNRDKELREAVMGSRDMFCGLRNTANAERESLLSAFFGTRSTRI